MKYKITTKLMMKRVYL